MNTNQIRIAAAGLFFLLIFVFGYWLSRAGKPYNTAIFTVHKLAALGAVVYLAYTIFKVNQAAPLDLLQIALAVFTGLCALGLFASGAVLSIRLEAAPRFVLTLHQVLPYLTVISTGALLYLLLLRGGSLALQ